MNLKKFSAFFGILLVLLSSPTIAAGTADSASGSDDAAPSNHMTSETRALAAEPSAASAAALESDQAQATPKRPSWFDFTAEHTISDEHKDLIRQHHPDDITFRYIDAYTILNGLRQAGFTAEAIHKYQELLDNPGQALAKAEEFFSECKYFKYSLPTECFLTSKRYFDPFAFIYKLTAKSSHKPANTDENKYYKVIIEKIDDPLIRHKFVSLLMALDYKRKSFPDYKLYFCHTTDNWCKNTTLETENYSGLEFCDKDLVKTYRSLDFNLHEEQVLYELPVIHEIGHLIEDILFENSDPDLSEYTTTPLLMKMFFPIDLLQINYDDITVPSMWVRFFCKAKDTRKFQNAHAELLKKGKELKENIYSFARVAREDFAPQTLDFNNKLKSLSSKLQDLSSKLINFTAERSRPNLADQIKDFIDFAEAFSLQADRIQSLATELKEANQHIIAQVLKKLNDMISDDNNACFHKNVDSFNKNTLEDLISSFKNSAIHFDLHDDLLKCNTAASNYCCSVYRDVSDYAKKQLDMVDNYNTAFSKSILTLGKITEYFFPWSSECEIFNILGLRYERFEETSYMLVDKLSDFYYYTSRNAPFRYAHHEAKVMNYITIKSLEPAKLIFAVHNMDFPDYLNRCRNAYPKFCIKDGMDLATPNGDETTASSTVDIATVDDKNHTERSIAGLKASVDWFHKIPTLAKLLSHTTWIFRVTWNAITYVIHKCELQSRM